MARGHARARQLQRMTLMMGYAGVYGSFRKHAGNAADRCGVPGPESASH